MMMMIIKITMTIIIIIIVIIIIITKSRTSEYGIMEYGIMEHGTQAEQRNNGETTEQRQKILPMRNDVILSS